MSCQCTMYMVKWRHNHILTFLHSQLSPWSGPGRNPPTASMTTRSGSIHRAPLPVSNEATIRRSSPTVAPDSIFRAISRSSDGCSISLSPRGVSIITSKSPSSWGSSTRYHSVDAPRGISLPCSRSCSWKNSKCPSGGIFAAPLCGPNPYFFRNTPTCSRLDVVLAPILMFCLPVTGASRSRR